jgi:hypothetical protein
MLYRHVQPLFISAEYTSDPVRGPKMRVRPLDSDAPDHLLKFVFWGAIQTQSAPPTRAGAPKAPAPAPAGKPPDPAVVVVTAPARPKLLIEMSADGEGWVVQSTLDPREKPYLVTVAHVLPYVRVRLEANGLPTRGYALVMANAPFALDGRSPIVGSLNKPHRPSRGGGP